MQMIDPVFISPRPISRDWGRTELSEWSGLISKEHAAAGEVWISDSANMSTRGELGGVIANHSDAMLGVLGRLPPLARLVFPGRRIRIASTSPMGFWIILDPGRTENGPVRHRGERIFARDGAYLDLAPASIALEVSPAGLPENAPKVISPLTWSLAAPSRPRATLQRDKALSVEMWTLPPHSSLTPDGRCCYIMTAISAGAMIDGQPFGPGDALMVPALGRALNITASRQEARIIVAYPDITSTAIWREMPGPPAAAKG